MASICEGAIAIFPNLPRHGKSDQVSVSKFQFLLEQYFDHGLVKACGKSLSTGDTNGSNIIHHRSEM